MRRGGREKSVLKSIDKNAERWALLIFYTMLVATMVVEVLRREIFSYSSIWGEEIVRYSFIYLAWIGASAAVRERAHIRIDVIFNYVPERMVALLYIFGDLVMLAVIGFALMTFRLLQSLFRDFSDFAAKRPPYEGERLFD